MNSTWYSWNVPQSNFQRQKQNYFWGTDLGLLLKTNKQKNPQNQTNHRWSKCFANDARTWQSIMLYSMQHSQALQKKHASMITIIDLSSHFTCRTNEFMHQLHYLITSHTSLAIRSHKKVHSIFFVYSKLWATKCPNTREKQAGLWSNMVVRGFSLLTT